MTLKAGSLCGAMQSIAPKKIAVLIIDQPEPPKPVPDEQVPDLVRYQQQLLAFANSIGCRFWRIELSQHGIVGKSPTATRLKGLIPPSTPVITKQRFNAFEGTTLKADLATAGVTHVVVLGHMMNCCVKYTAIGGAYRKTDPFVHGATGNGFKVMTQRKVLSGVGDADWVNEQDVSFYTSLG
ncbi:MAG TPA: isochorismatase family protein [Burkholderiales bacterium]|nr:isochorismatase family protein [Burkholderiales bacterium]